MKKCLLLFCLSVFFTSASFAQTKEHPWSINLGNGYVDFNGPVSNNYFDTRKWHGLLNAGVGRYLSPSFNLNLQLSAGDVWAPISVNTPETNTSTDQLERLYDGAFVLKYKFDNGYIFKEDAFAAPYAMAGLGVNYIQNDYHNFLPLGAGIRFRIGEHFNIYAQTQYNAAFNTSSDYLHHAVGLTYNFGKQRAKEDEIEMDLVDSDGDGINDVDDECPFAAGSNELLGCPDTDGDGVGDSRDKCPSQKGTRENNGCPASDRDNDGLADADDNCPDKFGDRRYNGCPDTDGDGISDNKDACVDVKGTLANNGCPEEIKKSTEAYAKQYAVFFDESSSEIRKDQYVVLDEAAQFIKSGNYYLNLNGYTSEEGSSEKNDELAMKRANNVYAYLASKGVKVYSTSYGWGENRPKYDNKTEEGRKKNRRVDIDIYSR